MRTARIYAANFQHEDYSFPLACDRIANIALRLRNFPKLRDKILNYTSLQQCPSNHRQQQTVGLIGPRGWNLFKINIACYWVLRRSILKFNTESDWSDSDRGPVYTIPDSLVTTSSFAVTEQWLVANAY
jgi:hypothetical protein